MTFDTLTVSLPAHWMPAIVNADITGLSSDDAEAVTRFARDNYNEFGHVVYDCASDTYFERWHDAAEYGVPACDCVEVTMFIPVQEGAA